MVRLNYKKHRLNKIIELLKYCFTLGLLCILVIKSPNQATQLVTAAGAFILGGAKLGTKIGITTK